MSKDQWIADHERSIERFCDGEISLDACGGLLSELGFDPAEIREELQPHMLTTIPKGYFGQENKG